MFSLAGFLYFGFGVVSGPLADRYGSRRMAWIGMALVALGLALASAARNMTQIYLPTAWASGWAWAAPTCR